MPPQRHYPDHPRLLGLLWRGSEQPSPRSGLTVTAVVDAAVQLAGEHGLAAVTMRRVAKHLEVGAMSLYTYLPGRQELVSLMVEHVTGELARQPPSEEDGTPPGWRTRLETIAREYWGLYERHGWLLDVPVGRPVIGPNVVERYEYELGVVEGIGLDDLEMNAVVELIQEHVAGTARRAREIRSDADASGMSDDEWWYAVLPILERVLADRDLPLTARVGEAIGAPHLDRVYVLEFGLARILDGIEVLIEQRATGNG